ncbi:FAD/FMN-containing dehydrogenase [Inhella inkyongensis]|uniref:FAD/FMN-containing dehydrogenase n=1 Tax=Inhella inkyongensis TaxID=392593 RepID=A0A840S978_9BURK|nr:FAD-binding oxidoreductase [Inhella inkyongensis]MBB5205344.1 FAD/FMN-containing dehydrogenase [Inhella inkyongensis]
MRPELGILRAEFGADQVLDGEAALPFERDWRGRATGAQAGRAMAVLCPRSVDEVQAMVRAAARLHLALVPQGGNTGLVLGGTPDASGAELVLSLKRLNRIRRIDPINATLTAEAGCVLQTLQQACAAQQLLLPLSLAAEGQCTLGGNLATNAGGTQVLRWGNARDLCLGLEVVTADGLLWSDLDGLRKDHRGLNLRDLFIGSEGVLGLITAAVMKLAPLPRSRLSAWLTLPSLEAALQLLPQARAALGDGLSGFEVMGQAAQLLLPELPLPAAPWALLVEVSSHRDEAQTRAELEAWLAPALDAGRMLDAVVAHTEAQAHALWALRESIPGAQTRAGGNLKHDIALPLDRIAAFVADCEARIQRAFPGARPTVFGHLGDGNLHFNVAPPVGQSLAEFQPHEAALNRLVFDCVADWGGSFSAEHGIGRLRAAELAARGDAVGLDLMGRIKQALDPANRLNPGRVLASGSDGNRADA